MFSLEHIFKDSNSLLIFFIFFIPGFVMLKIHRLFIADDKINFSQASLEVVSFSCINIVLALPVLLIYSYTDLNKNIIATILVGILCFLVLPIGIVWLYFKVSKTNWYRSKRALDPHRTAWDYMFSKGNCYWVVVTLKNGKEIAGNFKSNSYSSAYPHKDIYVEELWILEDGSFDRKRGRTAGIYIAESEIATIEFINH